MDRLNNMEKYGKYVCPKCLCHFSRSNRLESHLKRKNPCVSNNNLRIKEKFKIKLKNNENHEQPVSINLKQTLNDLQKQINELRCLPSVNPQVINNNLNIVCVGKNDNYLDMLTEEFGDFNKALEYIKDCALSDLTGDCKLIGKMYLSSNSVTFVDKRKTKIAYHNENKEEIIDTKELFGKKIANNLQNN